MTVFANIHQFNQCLFEINSDLSKLLTLSFQKTCSTFIFLVLNLIFIGIAFCVCLLTPTINNTCVAFKVRKKMLVFYSN